MKEQGYKQKDIALKTGKDKSVIFREHGYSVYTYN